MGKSPGKWIKTVLFGKKSSKSSFSKDATNEKKTSVAAKASSGNLAVNPPTISDLPHQTTDRSGENTEFKTGITANLSCDAVVSLSGKQGADAKPIMGLNAANNIEITKLEQAATKAQAFFRGYLARRAFRALKGIIRLQALFRGHLVRRQAVATLRCLQAIVNFQTLIRGRRVMLSNGGHNAEWEDLFGVNTFIWLEKLLRNAVILRLLASSLSAMPLSLQYDPADPNSVLFWLERWSSSRFWEPLAQPKKITDSKHQRKHTDMQTAETEPGRTKRGVGKISTVTSDNNLLPSSSEYEKPKRNPRKTLSHQAEQVLEHPQSELERVKRNLRKVSMSTEEASDKSEVVIEKPQSTPKKVSTSHAPDVCDQQNDISSEKLTDPIVTVSKQPVLETPPEPLPVTEQIDTLPDEHPTVELHNLENGGKAEKTPTGNEEPISKEDQTSKENQKTRRRRSLPAKQEYPENASHSTPTLPSYMAATESAKAKLKAQGSPRLGLEAAENGFVRRHSLPSSTNGKLSSILPRMPKVVQSNGKGGSRNDKSLSSSRDEKVLQPGWRR